jgi:hypothetical protein
VIIEEGGSGMRTPRDLPRDVCDTELGEGDRYLCTPWGRKSRKQMQEWKHQPDLQVWRYKSLRKR